MPDAEKDTWRDSRRAGRIARLKRRWCKRFGHGNVVFYEEFDETLRGFCLTCGAMKQVENPRHANPLPPAECDGCLCPSEHDGDYGSAGHPGPCPPHTCDLPPAVHVVADPLCDLHQEWPTRPDESARCETCRDVQPGLGDSK